MGASEHRVLILFSGVLVPSPPQLADRQAGIALRWRGSLSKPIGATIFAVWDIGETKCHIKVS